MPCPCRAHAVPLPCRAANGLECVFPIWSTQYGRVWFTLAFPCPCHAPTMPFFSRPRHGSRETACGLPARFRLLPATTRSSTKVVIRSIPISDAGGQCESKRLLWTRKRLVAAHYKKDNLLNCWTSSSDISGYHADFHEGYHTIGAWQGTGMSAACYVWIGLNRLMPNDPYMGRTAPLTSKRCILYIYSTNIGTEYFKRALYSPFFFLFKMQFVS